MTDTDGNVIDNAEFFGASPETAEADADVVADALAAADDEDD